MSVSVIDDGCCSKHDRKLDACSDCMSDALAELKVDVVAMRDRVVLERERREEIERLLAKALYLDGTGRSLDQTHVTQDVYLRAKELGIGYKSSSSSESESAP